MVYSPQHHRFLGSEPGCGASGEPEPPEHLRWAKRGAERPGVVPDAHSAHRGG